MKHLATCIVLAGVAGCGSASSPAKPEPIATPTPAALTQRLYSIEGKRVGPSQAPINEWGIDSHNNVRLTSLVPDGAGPPTLRTISFTAPPGAMAELHALLAAVEHPEFYADDCPLKTGDQGFVQIMWYYDFGKTAYSLARGCPTAKTAPKAKVLAAAEAKIFGWSRAAANPKIGDKPQ